jgi:predicted nucleic acid-binding protein
MYLVGAAHPLKIEAQLILERLIASRQRLVTDAEVFQEILHRYAAIGRREAMGAAFQVLLDVVDEVFPVSKREVLRAAEIAQLPASFSARDALHLAVMEEHEVRSIFTFDADFDRWPGLKRIATV